MNIKKKKYINNKYLKNAKVQSKCKTNRGMSSLQRNKTHLQDPLKHELTKYMLYHDDYPYI